MEGRSVKRFVFLGAGVVALLLGVFCRGGDVDAACEPREVSFYVRLQEGPHRVLGSVPAGRRLILKDFIGSGSQTRLVRFLVDGARIGAIGVSPLSSSLASGMVVETGELSVELQGTGMIELTVCGVLE